MPFHRYISHCHTPHHHTPHHTLGHLSRTSAHHGGIECSKRQLENLDWNFMVVLRFKQFQASLTPYAVGHVIQLQLTSQKKIENSYQVTFERFVDKLYRSSEEE